MNLINQIIALVLKMFDIVNEKDSVIDVATVEECHSNPKLIHRAIL